MKTSKHVTNTGCERAVQPRGHTGCERFVKRELGMKERALFVPVICGLKPRTRAGERERESESPYGSHKRSLQVLERRRANMTNWRALGPRREGQDHEPRAYNDPPLSLSNFRDRSSLKTRSMQRLDHGGLERSVKVRKS
jgi:hypothetical protein